MGEPSGQELEALKLRVHELLRDGRLPRVKAVRTWGGSGSGLPCDLCGAAILSSEPEFEIQLDLAPTGRSLRFHRQCHALWEGARAEAGEGGWTRVSDRLPAAETIVEGRVSLPNGRTLILNLLYRVDSATSRAGWLNATTLAPLPEGWNPCEWRFATALAPAAATREVADTSLPRRA
jgi:hypothetical protein